MLQVCIDDSRTEPEQGPVYVLGGFVARVRNWEALANDWKTLLGIEPRLPYLKGKQAYWRSGPFNGLSENERDFRVLQFVNLILKYKLVPVKLKIDHEDWTKQIGGIRLAHRRPFLPTPAYAAVSALTCAVLGRIMHSKTREKVQFIFDENVVTRKDLAKGYRSICARLPRRVTELIAHEPKFEDDKEFMPLQAADLFAYYLGTDTLFRSKGEQLKSPIWDVLSELPAIDASLDGSDLRELGNSIRTDVTDKLVNMGRM